MGKPSLPVNPYQPGVVDHAEPIAAMPVRNRPGGLIAICIISLLLGILGLLAALGGTAQLFVNQQIHAFGMPSGSDRDAMVELQMEMQAALAEIGQRYFIVNLILGLSHIGVASLLLIGAIATLCWKPWGLKLLIVGMALAILFELGRAVPGVLEGLASSQVMREYMQRMMETTAGGEVDFSGFGPIFNVMMYVMLAIGLGFVLIKIVFYAFSIRYLRKPETTVLFEGPTP